MSKTTTISLLSGGLDSATATGLALESGENVIGLSFNYGQRHLQELEAAAYIAKHLNLREHIVINVNLSLWGGSSLTDANQNIPTTGVIEGEIPTTYVPGRNTVFIAIGLSLAETKAAKKIVLGINAMDYSGYPDCRPDYLEAYQNLANLANKAGREGQGVKLWAPLISWQKTRIIEEAIRLKIPIEKTWSCYSGGIKACGICDSCRIRNQALIQAGRSDLCSPK
tara:strand:+ start:268 stop:942 length:675 start_codon:yes stop_codon:yes gene_type:complete